MVNVAEHLARMATERPTAEAVHLPVRGGHRTMTFAELNGLANTMANGLRDAGITRGMRTVLMVPPGADFFALTFALFRLAAVPVFIDPGMGTKNLGPCLATAQPQAFVGIPKAHVARKLFGWGRRTIHTTVNVGRLRMLCSAATGRFPHHPESISTPNVMPADLAAILFTSGSTGPAKGVEYTHGIFASQVEMLKSTYGIRPGEVDYCSFPLFALFGPALGMTCVVPRMEASRPASIDARQALADIAKFGVTNLFGSPVVIRKLAEAGGRLTTVRRAISAGAPATMAVVESFQTMLPDGVELFTPYGATESLPVANIGSRELLETKALTQSGHGVCVGRPVAGMTVDVIRISDDPISAWSDALRMPDGEIGEFAVRGPVVTARYYNRPEATAAAKIVDPATGTLWHRMGDVGYRDALGRLWFCGRKSHRVATKTGTLFTDQIEPLLNTVAPNLRTALVGVTRNGHTFPVVIVESADAILQASIAETIRSNPAMTAIRTVLLHPKPFPVDVRHQSKIFREKLAAWADGQLGPRWTGDES
jgi:acyl-CoA synthetase (AMP-forming)/AMP-acid ligase II